MGNLFLMMMSHTVGSDADPKYDNPSSRSIAGNASNASSCYRHHQMLREAIWLAAKRNRGREVNGELGLEIDFQDADTENDRNLVPLSLSQFRRRMRIAHAFLVAPAGRRIEAPLRYNLTGRQTTRAPCQCR